MAPGGEIQDELQVNGPCTAFDEEGGARARFHVPSFSMVAILRVGLQTMVKLGFNRVRLWPAQGSSNAIRAQ